MAWYYRLSELLPHNHSPTDNCDECHRLEHAVVNFYQTALLYFIGVTCYRGARGEPIFADANLLMADLLDKESALPASTGGRQIEVQLRLIKSTDIDAHPELNGNVEVEDASTVAFSYDGFLLALASGSIVTILRTEDGKEIRSLNGGEYLINPQSSPDSRYLTVGSWGIEFWGRDLNCEKETPRTFCGHRDSVRTVAFSSDGARIASGLGDCEIRV
ncbi:hypothetical protein F4802DRAFT_294816 [Xylaria palmicola]|nr:hypothetical protein F4802DRAFT_294816 [Xylaria palmicola]